MVCHAQTKLVLPIAFTLLVPLSPIGAIGLLPLALIRWCQHVPLRGILRATSLADILLALAFMVLMGVYFLRADGATSITLSFIAWGWRRFLYTETWILLMMGAPLLLPLCFTIRKERFFYTLAACWVLIPCIFIGTPPEKEFDGFNELWFKSVPAYSLCAACYWLQGWHTIHWYKYCYWGVCLLAFLVYAADIASKCGSRGYLEVDDAWNGHLNHEAPFLRQSIPPCREPAIPGILLRESGESEKHFPGCLLPKAPGCDYSRPAHLAQPR